MQFVFFFFFPAQLFIIVHIYFNPVITKATQHNVDFLAESEAHKATLIQALDFYHSGQFNSV